MAANNIETTLKQRTHELSGNVLYAVANHAVAYDEALRKKQESWMKKNGIE